MKFSPKTPNKEDIIEGILIAIEEAKRKGGKLLKMNISVQSKKEEKMLREHLDAQDEDFAEGVEIKFYYGDRRTN